MCFDSPRWEPEHSGDSLPAVQPEGLAQPGNNGEVPTDPDTWMERVLDSVNMNLAWDKVRANADESASCCG